jgi:hypothetical protein
MVNSRSDPVAQLPPPSTPAPSCRAFPNLFRSILASGPSVGRRVIPSLVNTVLACVSLAGKHVHPCGEFSHNPRECFRLFSLTEQCTTAWRCPDLHRKPCFAKVWCQRRRRLTPIRSDCRWRFQPTTEAVSRSGPDSGVGMQLVRRLSSR